MAQETKPMEPGTNPSKPMTILQSIGREADPEAAEPQEEERMVDLRSFGLPAAHTGLEHYLKQVRNARRLEREEELALFERWQNHGDLAARQTLLLANLRAVSAIAFKYQRYGVSLDELVAEGNLALVHALSRFDPSRGTRFMTYAAFWVRAHVLNHVIGSFSMVGAGSGVLRTKLFFKLRRERTRILNLVGEGEQADVLLANSLGLAVDTVRGMVRRLEARDVSIDTSASDGTAPLVDRMVSPDPSHEETLADLELSRSLRETLENAFASLDARERFIAESRLLADGEDQPSLAEIGRRLGVSRERARQLETRTKRKLRPKLELYAREAGIC
jgi:RNA polymerase sigma-32 factor